jgi:tetratricopeptide (TPR) repeat protein
MQTLRNRVQIITLLLAAVILSGCFAGGKKSRILERADRYFRAGEYDNAKIEYLNLLRLDNQNVTAFQQLGFIWFEQGVPLRAVPFLLKVRELAPQNVAARAKLALSFMAVGQPTEARKEALSILQQDSGNSDAIVVLADTSGSKEEISATEQQLEKFPQRDTAFHLASASLASRKGNLPGASDEVEQALAMDPKSSRAHLTMAYIYLLRKDPSHAGSELKSAADLAPLRSDERIRYAEFEYATGAVDEAKVSLQKITGKAPDYLPAWRLLAQIAFTGKKYDESLALLENIFTRDPDNPEARMLQSEVWLGKGDTGKAIATLDRLNSTYTNNAAIKYLLARAYLQSENLAQATAALHQAVAANPDYVEAILLLGELNLRSGKPQNVVAAMEDLRRKHPDLPQPRLLLANAYQALGRLDDAAALFRELIKMAPQSPEAYFFLGLILRQQEKADEARQAFEKASELAPDNLDPINQLVDMDLADKRYDGAMQRVQQQLQKKPDAAGAHFMEARIYAVKGDWARTEAALKKTIDLDANFAAAYELLVSVYMTANKLPQAIDDVQAFLSRSPNNPAALMTLGMIYEKMKDYPKARDTYEKLLTQSPDSVPALNNLAYLYAERLDRLDRAYELAQKAHTLQAGDGSVADTLGWVLYKRGDYAQGLKFLQESAAKLPENPQVQFHLGMASHMMGQADAARSAFEKAVHAAADFPEKTEAERRLAQLQQGSRSQTPELSAAELEKLLKQQPKDLITVNRLAEAYESQGDAPKAAAAYEQALKLNPKLLTAALKLAELYAGPLHNNDKALEFAKKARDLAPNDAQSAGVLGRIAFQAGNFAWAYSLLQESARQLKTDPGVLHDFALTNYALGKVPEARLIMQHCLDAGPDAGAAEEAKRFLAMTTLDQPAADIVAAQSEVQKILKAQPDYVPALMAQAAIQLQRNDAKSAAGIYSQVLRQYPDFAPAQKRLAAIYVENPDDLAKAYDVAIKARRVLPDDPEVARTLAEINFKRKEFPYAIQLLQESARKGPLPAKDLYCLGVAQLETKQDAKGRETLQRALAAGLQEPLAQDARNRLAEKQPK